MNAELAKLFRSVQVHFPYLQDSKFVLRRVVRRVLNRTHESDFEILPLLPFKHNLFIDVGANRGEAIQSMLMRAPSAEIVAFEPNRYLCEKLEKQYGGNQRINIINYGLGNSRHLFDLFIPFYNQYMFDGLASFKEENARNWLINRLYNFKKEKFELKKIACEVRRLDDFNMKPGFIKMDVQGFEFEVLQGAIQTIRRFKPILLIETPGPNELEFLTALHYRPFRLQNRILSAGTDGPNVFFFPEDSLEEIGKVLPLKDERRNAA